MQTYEKPLVDWMALEQFLLRGAARPADVVLAERIRRGAQEPARRSSAEIPVFIPAAAEPELVRWASLPF